MSLVSSAIPVISIPRIERLNNLGASVNGKPTVSKTVTAGSSPAAPVVLGMGLKLFEKYEYFSEADKFFK